jgi:hypothetical protein
MTSRGERWFVAVVFVLYAAATLAVALHHEPWRDEADPWLLIRDGRVSTMLARTGWAGMPALWYLALAPVVKLGLPYEAMTLLNLAFATTPHMKPFGYREEQYFLYAAERR